MSYKKKKTTTRKSTARKKTTKKKATTRKSSVRRKVTKKKSYSSIARGKKPDMDDYDRIDSDGGIHLYLPKAQVLKIKKETSDLKKAGVFLSWCAKEGVKKLLGLF